MALLPKLELRQGQQLVMTPQLQQAIRLLQLSNVELCSFVEAEVERNPLLEAEAVAPEPGPEGEAPHDHERARASERPALSVKEQLRPVPAVEVGSSEGHVPGDRVGRGPSERNDALPVAFADATDEARVEVDGGQVEADGLADSESGAVEQLAEGTVAERARVVAAGCLEQALGLRG